MPWTTSDPPRDARDLPANVRAKAVDVANQLVAKGRARDEAVRVATCRAKRWVSRRRKLGHTRAGKVPPHNGQCPTRTHGPRVLPSIARGPTIGSVARWLRLGKKMHEHGFEPWNH